MDINFILERYRPGGGNRYTCPFCGRKKCFARYIDVQTGDYVDETCGKCDHENSCPVVHYPPREFFKDHPERSRQNTWEPYVVNGKNAVLCNAKTPSPYLPVAVAQTEFFDIHWAEVAAERRSTFRTWFESLPFDRELIQKVFAEYYVGATQKEIIISGINYGPAAVFWMIDEQQRVHDAKLIAYQINGLRVEGWGNSMRSICKKTGKGPQLDETEKVLFGLHLLPKYPDKAVCIVESEKTALICACHYPKFLWLATGGCGNLQTSKLKPLLNRRVIVYPDSGECSKWKERMAESGHQNYKVMEFIDEYEPNTDIADVLLNVAKRRPTTAEQTWEVMKADNPVLNDFEAEFGPLEVCPF